MDKSISIGITCDYSITSCGKKNQFCPIEHGEKVLDLELPHINAIG